MLALNAQFTCFEKHWQDSMQELLLDIQRDVGADYTLYDEVHHLQLTTKEAVDQALLMSENFRRAQAAHAAKAASEAEAKEITDTKAKVAAEAQAIAKAQAVHAAKAAAEAEDKAIAKEQATHAAKAAAEVAKAIAEAKVWFWIPEARETEAVLPDSGKPKARSLGDGEIEATTAPPQLSNGERRRLLPTTLMFHQEPGDPSDVWVLSSKPKPQDSTQDVDIPSFETRFNETPDASVEDTGTLAPATEGPKVVPLDVSVEGPSTLAPTAGETEAKTSTTGTTVFGSSNAKSVEARHFWGNQDFQPPEGGSRFSELDLPLPRPPPEPVYATWVPSGQALSQLTSQLHLLFSPTSVNSQIIDLPYGWRNRDKHRKLRGIQDTYPDVTGEVNLTRSDTSKSPFSSPRPPRSWTTPRLDPDAGGSFYIDFESISTSYTQRRARTEANRSRTTDFIISETTREAYKQTSIISMLLYIVIYYSVHLVIVLFDHHGSGGSCVASGDYISAAQLMLIAHSLSRPVLV
jgi:hypothetical protein